MNRNQWWILALAFATIAFVWYNGWQQASLNEITALESSDPVISGEIFIATLSAVQYANLVITFGLLCASCFVCGCLEGKKK